MSRRHRPGLPPALRRVVVLAGEAGLDLAEALHDDGRIDLGEATTITLRLLAQVATMGRVLPTQRSGAWIDLAGWIERGNRAEAHAALDRAMGWTDATSDSGGPDRQDP